MGLFSGLFGLGKRDILESLSHFSGKKLQEFVVADDSSQYLRHYFRFKDRDGKEEEFIVIYRRAAGDMLRYARTHWRRTAEEKEFRTLNERSPWSSDISRLVDMGQELSSNARPTRTHLSLQISAEDLVGPVRSGQRVSQPPVGTTLPQSASPVAQPKPAKTLSSAPSQWQVRRGETDIDGPRPKDEFSRAYEFADLPPPDTTATVRIECTIESGGLVPQAGGSSGLSLNRRIRFYLRPFRLPHDAEFVLRVVTVDGAEGGDFDVVAAPFDSETAVFAKFGGRNDTATLLRALMAGKDLRFELLQDADSLVKLPLQNDGAFKQLWDEAANRFAQIETTYDLVRSQATSPPKAFDVAAEVKKNPQGYAIWMVEQEPGQFGVLLVKLDREGGMEDAWQLGQPFTNRSAQGSYALDAARDLGIKLMDVAKIKRAAPLGRPHAAAVAMPSRIVPGDAGAAP